MSTINEKMSTMEIDLSEFDKDLLILLIIFCHKYNLTFNEGIVKLLTSYLSKEDENQLPLL
jgi:hypothetical protein